MRALAVALLALLLAPVAIAQTFVTPIEGAYQEVYVVTGRVVDAVGRPVVAANVTASIDMRGARASPAEGTTDCFGVFLLYFTIGKIDPKGTMTVRVEGRGAPDVVETKPLDPFYRRTDHMLRYEGEWNRVCPQQTGFFETRLSVTGRILNRTEPYERNGLTYHARPAEGAVFLRYWDPQGNYACPPSRFDPRVCDLNAGEIDERGDFRYSWTFEKPVDLNGHIEVLYGDQSWNFTIDEPRRAAIAIIETTGQGPAHYESEIPAPGALPVLLVVGALLFVRSLLPRRKD